MENLYDIALGGFAALAALFLVCRFWGCFGITRKKVSCGERDGNQKGGEGRREG